MFVAEPVLTYLFVYGRDVADVPDFRDPMRARGEGIFLNTFWVIDYVRQA
jgi:hypothetical protein